MSGVTAEAGLTGAVMIDRAIDVRDGFVERRAWSA
jgi:hypothetical protein